MGARWEAVELLRASHHDPQCYTRTKGMKKMKTTWKTILGAALLGVVMAGCGSGDTGAGKTDAVKEPKAGGVASGGTLRDVHRL